MLYRLARSIYILGYFFSSFPPAQKLYNSASLPTNNTYGHTHFVVSSDGSVLWVPPAKLVAYCKVRLRRWPSDTQECALKMGSWTSHGQQIDLQLYLDMKKAEKHNVYTDNKEWSILDMPARKKNLFYSCCNESYPEVTFTFHLQRMSPAYSALIIVPCLGKSLWEIDMRSITFILKIDMRSYLGKLHEL